VCCACTLLHEGFDFISVVLSMALAFGDRDFTLVGDFCSACSLAFGHSFELIFSSSYTFFLPLFMWCVVNALV
jgi:hypothetical protein